MSGDKVRQMADVIQDGIVAATTATATGGDDVDDDETPGCRLYKFVVLTNVGGLIIIFGFVGNLIAFIVFQKDSMKTSTSFLFQALSVIDNVLLLTAFPLFCLPALVKYFYPEQYIQNTGQHPVALVYVLPIAFLAQTAIIWVTVLVGAARLCTVRQAKLQLAVVLSLVLLYSIPRFAQARLAFRPAPPTGSATASSIDITTDTYENEAAIETETGSDVNDGEDVKWQMIPQYTSLGEEKYYWIVYDNILYTVVMLVLPLTTLTALNVRLVRELRTLRRKRAEMQSTSRRSTGTSSTSASTQDSNVTLVLIIVVLVFIVCQAPALATQLFWTLLDNPARSCGGFQYYFGCVSNLLVVANSAANFPIYVMFNTRFRVVLRQTVCPAAVESASPNGTSRGGSGSAQRLLREYVAPVGQPATADGRGHQEVCPAAAGANSGHTAATDRTEVLTPHNGDKSAATSSCSCRTAAVAKKVTVEEGSHSERSNAVADASSGNHPLQSQQLQPLLDRSSLV